MWTRHILLKGLCYCVQLSGAWERAPEPGKSRAQARPTASFRDHMRDAASALGFRSFKGRFGKLKLGVLVLHPGLRVQGYGGFLLRKQGKEHARTI